MLVVLMVASIATIDGSALETRDAITCAPDVPKAERQCASTGALFRRAFALMDASDDGLDGTAMSLSEAATRVRRSPAWLALPPCSSDRPVRAR